jgi:hypothetical protein
VKAATAALGDLTGNPPQENLKKLAAKIREQTGRCALGGIEAVFIVRDDGRIEENHAVYFGDGGWANGGAGKFKGCHSGGEFPEIGACTNPDPTGLEARFVLKRHHQEIDSTYQVKSRDYCMAAGWPDGTRTWCPLRAEGHPDREACEAKHIGLQQWWCDGQPLGLCGEPMPESCVWPHNRAQARCHGHARTCTGDGRTCAELDW